jgi:uncharacterized membrane protein
MTRLHRLWYDVRSSLWFVPGAMLGCAIALALLLIEIDTRLADDLFAGWPRIFGAGAEGARGLLETIAGSMISVAGVVFSITLVALSLASSQYTSRVLRHFMRDRANQLVLGSFVGIFAYCLVVLRTIRGADEGSFVPALAVLVGLLLGLAGIAVLVFFIHHISASIQAAQILATVGDETLRVIDKLYPAQADEGEAGDASDPDEPVRAAAGQSWHAVRADRTGYVEQVDVDALLVLAIEHDGVLFLERGIGDFLIDGVRFASLLAARPPNEADAARLRAALSVGRMRTLDEDVAFGIRQLVDVALKALSPGINDSTTAEMCLDRLGAVLVRLADRPVGVRRHGADGRLRLHGCGPDYRTLAGEALDRVRRNAAGNVSVLHRLFDVLRTAGEHTRLPGRRAVLLGHAQAVAELARRSVLAPQDSARLDTLAAHVLGELGSAPLGPASAPVQAAMATPRSG